MQGQAVYRQAVVSMADSASRAMADVGWTVDDVDWFVGHQANQRILDAVANRVGIAPERAISNVAHVGNTAAASIPLALSEAASAGRLPATGWSSPRSAGAQRGEPPPSPGPGSTDLSRTAEWLRPPGWMRPPWPYDTRETTHGDSAHGQRRHRRRRPRRRRRVLRRTRHGAGGQRAGRGSWAERVIGLDDMRSEIAMLRIPDGHGRLELAKYHTPKAISPEPKDAPANTLGMHRVMFAVDDIEDISPASAPTAPNSSARWRGTRTSTCSATSAVPRASSSGWPNSSADRRRSDE